MTEWSEELLIRKLREGFVLHGDCGSEVPLGLIDAQHGTTGPALTIPAKLVRRLFGRGIIGPCSPGEAILYKLRDDAQIG